MSGRAWRGGPGELDAMGEPRLPMADMPVGWDELTLSRSHPTSHTPPHAHPVVRPALAWTAFGGTHQGRVRPINEDRFLVRADEGLFAVADGMGGHSHGDVAASAIVTELDRAPLPVGFEARAGAVCGAVDRANGAIRDVAGASGLTIGSTVVALMVHASRHVVLWCGDSRAYRVREGGIERLTRDHSAAAALVASDPGAGTDAGMAGRPGGGAILHAVGVSHRPHIDRGEGEALAGDVFVLCSDGLTGHVSDADIARLCTAPAPGAAAPTPEEACRALIRAALADGGSDNVSVVVVRCTDGPA